MSNSKFIVIAAPSGSGKTTIVNKLLKEKNLNLSFSVSATSRAPRNNEVDGLNYFFLTKDEFIKRIENKEFIEWEEVYENTYYGTLISELENSSQKNLIFDIDVVGGLNIKKKFPKQTITIFIKPPSINELETRLINRNLDSDSSIKTINLKSKDLSGDQILEEKFTKYFESSYLMPKQGENINTTFKFYYGPTDYKTLQNLEGDLEASIPMGWGIFGWINKFIFLPLFGFLSSFLSLLSSLILAV